MSDPLESAQTKGGDEAASAGPLSLSKIKELLATRKAHARSLRTQLDQVFEVLAQIEAEIRKLQGGQEGDTFDPGQESLPAPAGAGVGFHSAGCREQEGRGRALLVALEAADWNASAAARAIGLHRNTVSAQMKKYGIKRPNPDRRSMP